MTILKQSPSKNLRYKGFKVKHFLQICLLLAICLWLLHRVKNSYDWKRAYEEGTATQSEVKNELESIHFAIQTTLERERRQADEPEEIKDEGRGGGDDEIKGSDQERSEEEEPEEVEDLIDEEDETAEQENEEAENRLEDEYLVGKPGVIWRRKWFRSKREELYKGENAAGR